MTLEEFLAACGNARTVSTVDGPALLVGGHVIQCRGLDSSVTEYIAKALCMLKVESDPNAHAAGMVQSEIEQSYYKAPDA